MIFLVYEKYQANGWQPGCLCAGMEIISEAKLPIYQKSWMAQRATRHLRLLPQLKCLTALKNLQQVSELYLYHALNQLSCTTLDVTNVYGIHFTVFDYPRKSCTRTCHDPFGHTGNLTVTTCTDEPQSIQSQQALQLNQTLTSWRIFHCLQRQKDADRTWSYGV